MVHHKNTAIENCSEVYEQASKKAASIAKHGKDLDIKRIRIKYKGILKRYPTTTYSEDRYIDKMLTVRELVKALGITQFGVKWESFKSPIEVLGYYASTYVWSPRLVLINEKDPTGKYEIDILLKDGMDNTIFLLDLQGKVTHSTGVQKPLDKRKREYFREKKIRYLQIDGTLIKNHFSQCVGVIGSEIEASLNQVDVSFFCNINKLTQNKTCYRQKP